MILQRKVDRKNSLLDVIWYVEENPIENNRRNDIIVPTGHVHMVYNFHDPYFLDEGEKKVEIPNVVLVGQFTKAVKIKYGDHVKQLGLAVHPYAINALFNQMSGLYTGAIMDCSQIKTMRSFHKKIIEIINRYDDVHEIFNRIEAYFNSFEVNHDTKMMEAMMTYVHEKKGLLDVKAMADCFAYSISGLERNFKKNIGLTPKAYGNILRFRYAMLESDPQILFYDQSHFIKNCKKYTHKIPTDLSSTEEISLRHMLEIYKD